MSITAQCKLFGETAKEVKLEGLDKTWTPSDVYDVCEDKLGVKIKSVENLEDVMAEAQYMAESKEEI